MSERFEHVDPVELHIEAERPSEPLKLPALDQEFQDYCKDYGFIPTRGELLLKYACQGPPYSQSQVCSIIRRSWLQSSYIRELLDKLEAQKPAQIPAAPQPGDPEICICAAVRTRNALIRCHRHGSGLRQLAGLGELHDAEQGFITSRNRFVNREEALKLQLAAGISPQGRFRSDSEDTLGTCQVGSARLPPQN